MNFCMVKAAPFQESYHLVHRSICGAETERTRIGHNTGIQTFSNIIIDLVAVARAHNKIIYHLPGRAFRGITDAIIEASGIRLLVMIYQHLNSLKLV